MRTNMVNPYQMLTECGIPVSKPYFLSLNEANQLQTTDAVLTGMMKFITDTYNSIDFSEIERSQGDIRRFKYTDMLLDNLTILSKIYESSNDPGAEKYREILKDCQRILEYLDNHRKDFSTLYKSGNGLIQMLYTSMVSSVIMVLGLLVNNTIRFVTTEKDTDCTVLYDEIPGTIKHIHIKNVRSVAGSLDDITYIMNNYLAKKSNRMNESVTLAGALTALGIGAAVLLMIPRILNLIREIIYSVYYMRVKMHDLIALQEMLLKTNIESLEARGEKPVIIVRQRRIATMLEKMKAKLAVKVDTNQQFVNAAIQKENKSLGVEPGSPYVENPESSLLI